MDGRMDEDFLFSTSASASAAVCAAACAAKKRLSPSKNQHPNHPACPNPTPNPQHPPPPPHVGDRSSAPRQQAVAPQHLLPRGAAAAVRQALLGAAPRAALEAARPALDARGGVAAHHLALWVRGL